MHLAPTFNILTNASVEPADPVHGGSGMRLSEDKIKAAIVDPELDKRDRAIEYFYDSKSPDQSIMPLAIDALEKYGRKSAFTFTHKLNRLPQSVDTLRWVADELKKELPELSPAPKRFYLLNLCRLLCHVEVPLLLQCIPDVADAPNFDPKERIGFLERIAMLEWDGKRCWDALIEHCELSRDKRLLDEFDWSRADRIVEALARHRSEYEDRIIDLLSANRQPQIPWLPVMVIKAAGAMRLEAAISELVQRLGHFDSYISDQSMFALAKIGTESVVSAVLDRFQKSSSVEFRHSASDLLGCLNYDLTVEGVLRLLPVETDLPTQAQLCQVLINHFAEECVEPTRQLLKRNRLDLELRDLRSHLVTACKIMEVRFPEFDEWKEAAKHDEEHVRNTTVEVERMFHEAGGDLGTMLKMITSSLADGTLPPAKKPRSNRRPQELFKEPVVNSSTSRAKAGRNDPCPCGSGKKFKSCCLRKQVSN